MIVVHLWNWLRGASHEEIAKVASDATYGGSATIGVSLAPHYIFGLPVDEWQVLGIIVGMIAALGGLATNFYFKLRHDRRLERAMLQQQRGEVGKEEADE